VFNLLQAEDSALVHKHFMYQLKQLWQL